MGSGTNYRATLTAVITFIGGLYFFLEFVLPSRLLDAIGVSAAHEQISYGFITVGSMALGLGLINLFMIHGAKIVFQKRGWIHSAALLTGLILMMYLSFSDWLGSLSGAKEVDYLRLLSRFAARIPEDLQKGRTDVPPLEIRIQKLREAVQKTLQQSNARVSSITETGNPVVLTAITDHQTALAVVASQEVKQQNLEALSTSLNNMAVARGKIEKALREDSLTTRLFHFLRQGLFVSLGSAMFSLLAFYIAAAAYRAFRIKSWESGLMMAAAVIVMCGQMSFTLRLFGGFSEWRGWLMDVPNSAAFRAIRIGAAVAGLILAFRMWFSIESDSFSEQE